MKIWRGLPGREEVPMITRFEDEGKGFPGVELREVAGEVLRVKGSELPRWIKRRKKRNGLGIDIV